MKTLLPIAMLGLCNASFGASVATAVTNLEAVGDVTVTGGTAQSTTTATSNISSNQGVVGSSSASGGDLSQTEPGMNPENFLFTSIEEAVASVRRSNSRGKAG